MDNKKIITFLRFLNIKLDDEDVKAINGEPDDEPKEPVNETPADAVIEEAVLNAAPPPAATAPPPAAAPAAVPPPAPAGNLPLLDQLINDIGGFEAFKAVLLKVVEAGQPAATTATPPAPPPAAAHNEKRDELVGKILANSKGMTAVDLALMDEDLLEKVFEVIEPVAKINAQPVDYGALSANQQKTAGKHQPAPRPVVLLGIPQGAK